MTNTTAAKAAHPDVHTPWSGWSESETLHVASAYNNPFRWQARRRLMNDFRHHMSGSPNVALHVGELAYGDRPFEVTGNDPFDIQLRTEHELWHKENLLNAVIARFPADWKYGAYIDADFVMTRHDWALEAIHLLQHYDFVQLFSSYADLSVDHRPFRIQPSFAYAQINYQQDGSPMPGAGAYGAPASIRPSRALNTTPGATGGAWAFRREAFDKVGSLLDTCILGAGDWYMAFALIGKTTDGHPEATGCGPQYELSVRRWQERAFAAVRGNFGYIDNHAVHHWHGSKTHRAYGTRWQILRDNHFDPYTDIYRDWQGIYQLTGNKPKLRDDIRRYFLARCEDNPALAPGEIPLV